MTRPCDCRKAGTGPHQPGWCYLCWLAANTAEYGPLWGGATPAAPAPIPKSGGRTRVPAPEPCAHKGRDLTGPERAAASLSHARRWALCLHPDTPLGEHVCGCMTPAGCGPRCAGYSQAPAPGAIIPP